MALSRVVLQLSLLVVSLSLLLGALPALILIYWTRHTRYHTSPEECCGLSVYSTVQIQSFDSVNNKPIQLVGWFFPHDPTYQTSNHSNKDACVLVVHGHAANMAKHVGTDRSVLEKAVRPLVHSGYNVLAIDLRNHGRSDDGTTISFGLYESTDVISAMKWLVENQHCGGVGEERIALWGESMGGATVLFAASRQAELPVPVRAVVADSSFSSLEAVILPWIDSKLPYLPSFFVDNLIMWIQVFAPFDIRDVRIDEAVRKIEAPIFLVHGEKDNIVPFSHFQTLNEALCPSASTPIPSATAEVEAAVELWSPSKFQPQCFNLFSFPVYRFWHAGEHVRAFTTKEYHPLLVEFYRRHL